MPSYKVTDNATGLAYVITGDRPPTEEELTSIFDKVRATEPPAPELSGKETALAGLEKFAQGATLGFQDEVGGFVGAAIESVFGDPFEEYNRQNNIEQQKFSERMADYTQMSRDRQAQFAAENPITAALLEGAGMVVTGLATGGATMAGANAMTNAARVAQGGQRLAAGLGASTRVASAAGRAAQTGTNLGLIAGLEGGLYGFGIGEGGLANRLESAANVAKVSAAIGGGLGVTGSAAVSTYKLRQATKSANANRIALETKAAELIAKEGDELAAKPGEAIARAADELGLSVDDVALVEANAPLRLPTSQKTAQIEAQAAATQRQALSELPGTTSPALQALDKLAGQIRTRVGGISPQIKRLLDNFEASAAQGASDVASRLSNLKLLNTLPEDTIEALKISFRLGDRDAINQTLALFPKVAEKVRPQLDDWFDNLSGEMYQRGVKSGVFAEGEGILNYWPAKIKADRYNDLMKVLYGTVPKSAIEKSKIAYAKQLGVEVKDLTKEQIDELYQRAAQGQVFTTRVQGLSRPGFTKERSLENITSRLSEFYEDPITAMNQYLHRYTDELAFRETFGLNKLVAKRAGASKAMKEQGRRAEGALDVDTNVRDLIRQRVDQLEPGLTVSAQDELVDLIEARHLARSTTPGKFQQAMTNLGTTFALGTFKSAALQVADVISSGFHNGVGNTAKAIARQLLPGENPSAWKTADVGIDNILVADLAGEVQGITGKLRDASLKFSGFRGMDKIGKWTHLNALHNKFTAMAKNDKAWQKLTDKMQGEYTAAEMAALRAEFSSGVTGATASPQLKSFMFSQIMDRLPITRSNMPEAWARNPKMRWAYQLKSFGLQQADLYRRNFYREWKAGNKAEAAKYALGFTGFVGGTNALVDEARRVAFQDKEMDFAVEDLPENFMWQSIMLSTVIGSPYLFKNIGREGAGSAIVGTVTPPVVSILDAISRDANKLAKDGVPESITELKTVQMLPLLGDPLRYWIGEGGERWEEGR